jgi:hypothetical protein
VEPTIVPPAAVPDVLDKLQNAAREPEASYGPSTGTRARARNAVRLMSGQPLFVKQNKDGQRTKQAREKENVVLTREERLQRRNAMKERVQTEAETVVVADEQEIAEVSKEEVNSGNEETGERSELVPQEGGKGDAVSVNVDGTSEVAAMHVCDAQPRVFTNARCDSLKENVLRREQGSLTGEARERES